MNVIQAIKIGNTINVSINGSFRKANFESPEEATKIFGEILKIRENPTEENLVKLKQLLNEKTRFVALASDLGNFEIDAIDGKVYLGGFNTPIPDKLYEVIKEYYENKFTLTPIVNFWKLLMANPDVEVRENLFEFITRHDFVLTDNGYMLVYKAVKLAGTSTVTEQKPTTGDSDLYEFVGKEYLKIKKWKKSPAKFNVYRKPDNSLVAVKSDEAIDPNYKLEGNLGDLHGNIGNLSETSEVRYTDKHTGTMDIRLGIPVKQARKECDSDPKRDCSNGLHVGATSYVEGFASINDPILVCLVNPMNVIAVPDYDKTKMRVCEYFPIALASFKNKKIEIVEEKYFECDYKSHEENSLNDMLAKIKENQQPIQTAKNAKADTRSLAELQKIIENRLVDLKL